MLFIESRTSETHLGQELRRLLLERLKERGHVPLIRSTRLHCYETALAGTDRAEEMDQALAAWAATEEDAHYIRGDLFCSADFVLFLLFADAEDARRGLRAGVVYEAETGSARTELDAFCDDVSEAIIAVRSKTANHKLEAVEWEQSLPDELPGLENFSAGRETDARLGGREVSSEAQRAVELLESMDARRLLWRIREAHADGSVTDLLSGLKGKTETEALMSGLTGAGLLRREVVISCRQVERPLFRLPSPDALTAITASNAICSECGANIADEKIEELVVPTALASTLLEDASWLTSRLRSMLRQLGVSEEQIINGPVSKDGEAYLMVNVCRAPFLFVLKDGDLTLAHARHALGKQIETEAPHLVVVATGKIQDEARARLREHARRRSRSGASEFEVLLIESVEKATADLEQAFERVSSCALAEELSPLDRSLGISVGHMLTTRFRLMRRPDALKNLAASASQALTGNL